MCAVGCVICSGFRRVAVCECRLAAVISLARAFNGRQLADTGGWRL